MLRFKFIQCVTGVTIILCDDVSLRHTVDWWISFFKKANIYDISEIMLIIIYFLKICLILHTSKIRNATSHISRGCNNLIRIEGGGRVGVIMCAVLHQNGDRKFWQIEYLGFHNYNIFICFGFPPPLLEFKLFLSDQFSLLMYLCLLPSSATVKMDNGENMENVRYAMNDNAAGFINQMKSRNTSRKIEWDLKLIQNYFVSINT